MDRREPPGAKENELVGGGYPESWGWSWPDRERGSQGHCLLGYLQVSGRWGGWGTKPRKAIPEPCSERWFGM